MNLLPDPAAVGAVYAGVRARVTDLLADATPETSSMVVVTCPDWTVRELVTHLAGVCDDVLAGRLEGVATPAWTEAQVQRLREESLGSALEFWSEVAPSVEAITAAFPPSAAAQWVFDAVTHEHDLRATLGAPGARDSDAVAVGAAFLLDTIATVAGAGLAPTLAVTLDDEAPVTLGTGEPVVTLRATRFEVLRALGGRRSVEQVRALDWSGDPSPYLHFTGGILAPPAEDIIE